MGPFLEHSFPCNFHHLSLRIQFLANSAPHAAYDSKDVRTEERGACRCLQALLLMSNGIRPIRRRQLSCDCCSSCICFHYRQLGGATDSRYSISLTSVRPAVTLDVETAAVQRRYTDRQELGAMLFFNGIRCISSHFTHLLVSVV